MLCMLPTRDNTHTNAHTHIHHSHIQPSFHHDILLEKKVSCKSLSSLHMLQSRLTQYLPHEVRQNQHRRPGEPALRNVWRFTFSHLLSTYSPVEGEEDTILTPASFFLKRAFFYKCYQNTLYT